MAIESMSCRLCGESFEYGQENSALVDTSDLPDGYFVPESETGWVWVCDDCGSCPTCGASRVDYKPRCEHQAHSKDGPLRWGLLREVRNDGM